MRPIAALSSQAPLMSVPDARCPLGGIGEWYRGAGGLRLRQAFWVCSGEPRGTVFVSTGRSEPIEKYYEVIQDLLDRDFCVVAHDWRSQGLSARLLPERLKCHARSYQEFLDDYQRLLDGFEDRAPKPWIMLAHSMGAAINLATLAKGEERITGAIFTNPMLRVKTGKHSLWAVNFRTDWNVRHGHSTDYVPDLFDDPFEQGFEHDALTHDRERYDRWREQLYACPHLGVGSPTWGWLNFAIKIGDMLLKDKTKSLKKIKIPISIVSSGDDSVVHKQFAKSFVKKLPLAKLVEVPGADHEILIEESGMRAEFWREFDELSDHVAPRGGHQYEIDSDYASENLGDLDQQAS